MRDVLLWAPKHWCDSVGRSAKTYLTFDLPCIGFHFGRVEPASFRASTASRTIASHVCWSWARLHGMVSQSLFHRWRPTTWGPDNAARSSLIVLAHVFSRLTDTFSLVRKRSGEKHIADDLSLWVSSCVPEPSETALEQDGWKRTEFQATTWSSCEHTIDSAAL